MTPDLKKALKSKAHALKPVILLGQHGLTPAVLAEIENALNTHELIKVKVPGVEREVRRQVVTQILEDTVAELVQIMGQIATLYRKNQNVSAHPPKKAQKKR